MIWLNFNFIANFWLPYYIPFWSTCDLPKWRKKSLFGATHVWLDRAQIEFNLATVFFFKITKSRLALKYVFVCVCGEKRLSTVIICSKNALLSFRIYYRLAGFCAMLLHIKWKKRDMIWARAHIQIHFIHCFYLALFLISLISHLLLTRHVTLLSTVRRGICAFFFFFFNIMFGF